MNKIRRKALNDIMERMEMLKCELEVLRDEEQDYLDNMPENLQGSERYEAAESAVDNMDSAVDDLADAISYIEEAMA